MSGIVLLACNPTAGNAWMQVFARSSPAKITSVGTASSRKLQWVLRLFCGGRVGSWRKHLSAAQAERIIRTTATSAAPHYLDRDGAPRYPRSKGRLESA